MAQTRNTSIKADKDDQKKYDLGAHQTKGLCQFWLGNHESKEKLKENETLNEESNPIYFKPLFMSADDLIAPNVKR